VAATKQIQARESGAVQFCGLQVRQAVSKRRWGKCVCVSVCVCVCVCECLCVCVCLKLGPSRRGAVQFCGLQV